MPPPTFAVAQSLPLLSDLPTSIQHHLELADLAASAEATLLIFPELSLTGYHLGLRSADAISPTDPQLAPLQALADKAAMTIVVGAPVLGTTGLHIGSLVLAPRRPIRTHLKVYLHPGEETVFTPGSTTAPIRVGTDRVGLAICADITYPEHVQAAVDRGCTVYAAGCFLTPTGYTADATLLQGYAQRYHMPVMMANYGAPSGHWHTAGRSAIWAPSGGLLLHGPQVGPAVLLARRRGDRWQTRMLVGPRSAVHAV